MIPEDLQTVTFSDVEDTEYGDSVLESARQLTLTYRLHENRSNAAWDALVYQIATAMHDAAMDVISE